MPPKHRDISPFLKLIRDFLLGRKHSTAHRFSDEVSPRTVMNGGEPVCEARLSGNHYFTRNARCQVRPPLDLVEANKREMATIAAAASKAAEESEAAKKDGKPAAAPTCEPCPTREEDCQESHSKIATPGKLHQWD